MTKYAQLITPANADNFFTKSNGTSATEINKTNQYNGGPLCPTDNITVNENKARIVAFFALLIVIGYLLTGYLYLLGFLLGDFLLRTTPQANYSLLSILADGIVANFNVKYKPTDRAPKRFAAGTGLVFTILILATAFLQFSLLSLGLTIIVAVFAILESFVGFCAGCYVYSILKNLGLIKNVKE